MKYTGYEKALSVPRIGKYKIACNSDKNKALILLYFDPFVKINVVHVQEIYTLIIRYIEFLDYRSNELLYGVETPLSTIEKTDELAKAI